MKPERFYRIVRKAENKLKEINKPLEDVGEPIKQSPKFIDKIKKYFRFNMF